MKRLALPNEDRPAVVMSCDALGCIRLVRRAPRIVIPSATPFELGHLPLRIMTTLHFCEPHRSAFDVAGYWTDAIKRRAEVQAKQLRPLDFRCDFEKAWTEMVLVTTPEYRAFTRALGVNCVSS